MLQTRWTVLLTMVLFGCLFSSSCSLMRPAMNAASDEAQAWWNEKGKAQVEQMAKEAAGKAADGALEAAKTWASQKVEDNNKRLEALGVNPDNLKTLSGAYSELKVGLKAIEENEKKPPEQRKDLPDRTELYIAIATIVLGGHFGKGVYRRVTNRGAPLKDAPPLKT